MKRLVTGLLLASVLLVAGVVSASAAVTIYQDPNATLLVNAAGSSAWLFLMNAGTTPVNTITITVYDQVTIDYDHSYVYKFGGTQVPFTLDPAHPTRYTVGGPRTWVESDASDGRIVRLWMPTSVLPYEYVIVQINQLNATTPIRVYSAEFGNIG